MRDASTTKKLIRITTVPMAMRYLLPGQMHFMAENGFDVLMISADGKEIRDIIKNEQCPHIIVPMTRKITPFQDLSCLLRLIRIFRREKPDIVHTHTPKAGLLGMLAARYCGVKIRIHTVAGLPMMVEKGFKYWLLKQVEKLTYKAANHVWPNSNSLMEFISAQRLVSVSKLKVIGKGSTNGIDLNRFDIAVLQEKKIQDCKVAIDYSDQNKYLLCVSRLVVDKGITLLINAFMALQKTHPSVRLILVGDYESELNPLPEATLKEIENNEAIIHISWTPDVEYYMHIADHFIFPSFREGFPNVLLQAGAMELPIVCSRIAGNIDIVTHNETGLIFEDRAEKQMLDMVEYALANPVAVQKMAKRLRQIIEADYRRENIWQNMLTAYKSLVN